MGTCTLVGGLCKNACLPGLPCARGGTAHRAPGTGTGTGTGTGPARPENSYVHLTSASASRSAHSAMGAGASTGKASKSSITKGGAKALEEAAKSEAKAKKLFVKLDADQDGKISLDELKAGVAKHAVDIASTWTSEQLALTIAFFDRDGDGKLSEPEFMSVIEELKVRGADDKGGVAAAAAIADKSKRRAAYAATFDKYKGDRNGVERKHMAQLIRDINDQQGIWDADAFGPLVKAQWEILVQSTDKQAVADLGQFCTWYAGLEKIIEDVKRQWVEEEAAAKAAKECQPPGGTRPTFSGDVWDCPMSKLQFAYMQAWESNMTPLLVDTTNDGKDQDFSPLETFFGYSGEGLIELKKAVVEVGMKKTKSLEQVQEEFAEKLALCLKQGRCLTLLCSNSAPPFLSKHVEPIARTAATPECDACSV